MNIALNDSQGDGYGVFADVESAKAEAERLGFSEATFTPTDAPVNNGHDPEGEV